MKAVWVSYRAVIKRPKEGDSDPMSSLPIEERIARLAEELRNPGTASELTSGLVRQAARLVVAQILAAEVDERLGWPRYVRREADRVASGGAGGGARGGGEGQAAPVPVGPNEAAGAALGGCRNGFKPRQQRRLG